MSTKLTGIGDDGMITSAGDTGTMVTDGSLVIGNADTDNVTFNADVASNIVPDTDNTYDLGATAKRWRRGYFDEVITKLQHVNTAKYSRDAADQRYVRWNNAGSDDAPGVNNNFVAPANGQLLHVHIRASSAANVTVVGLHKAGNGDSALNTTPIESTTVDMTSPNTSYSAMFHSNSFSAGDILGISVDPAASIGNVDITCIWLFDWALE